LLNWSFEKIDFLKHKIDIMYSEQYEYEFTFNLCDHRYMSNYSVSRFDDGQLHYGINDGSGSCFNCAVQDSQYHFIHETNAAPSLLHLYTNSIIRDWIKSNLPDFHVNLDANETLRGYYRCYKNLKITLLPPRYDVSDFQVGLDVNGCMCYRNIEAATLPPKYNTLECEE
jgi:hypothetical protein